jgi:hypothetical protein
MSASAETMSLGNHSSFTHRLEGPTVKMHLEITSGSFWFMVLCAGVAGVSGLMFGYDSGK